MLALILRIGSDRQDKINDVAKKCVALSFLLFLCLTTLNAIPSAFKRQIAISSIARRAEETRGTFHPSKFSINAVNLPKSRDAVGFSRVGLTGERPTFINITRNHNGHQNTHVSRKHRRNRSKKTIVRRNRRRKRNGLSRGRVELEQKSCSTRTNYVFKKTAEDIFGDKVDVYPMITIGNLAVDQYFYETYCYAERCTCRGINSKRFKSSCQTTHSYTYAKVVKSGEIGWSFIKVRSGCSCMIQQRMIRSTSVKDLIIAHGRR